MSARQLWTLVVIVACAAAVNVAAQGRGGRGGGAPAGPARTNPPVHLTGTWVPVITEDWRYRVMTAPNGQTGGIPMSPSARQAAMEWDRSKDGSCQAYGVGGLMRMPVRFKIAWADDNTLLAGGPWLPNSWLDEGGIRQSLNVLARKNGSYRNCSPHPGENLHGSFG